ncbi:MAG: MATE family efflux transporter [Candidatus Symbiothrix sp.]|jgi:O-antigen/teichoic acid export membrane protein|nr:MATE family efflux transporter [Candidatus Symbiothrix sp.]
MVNFLPEKIRIYFSKGNERSRLTKKNIAAAFLLKGVTILISLILIPLTINYIGPEGNGIWVTLYSMIVWLNLFDIGFGNGLKNKLAEAKARGETTLAQQYISSTYAWVSLICAGIFIAFFLVNPCLDWLKILGSNVQTMAYQQEIPGLVWIFLIAFCFSFVLNLIKSIVAADQRPAIGSFLDMLGQLLTLLGIFILSKTTTPSLIALGWVTAFAPVVVYIVAHIVLFGGRYKSWAPSFSLIDMKLGINLLRLGFQFFIATVASVVVTQTLPFLINHMSNPTEVTNFNTAFRLFSVAFNAMALVIIPYWSSFTDAYTQQDFVWMKKSVKQLHRMFLLLLVGEALILVLSPYIYYLWVNYWMNEDKVLDISMLMSAAICLYVCMLCWINLNIYPLNGIGKVRLQVYSSIVEIIVLIPIALFLGKHWGAIGVVLAPTIVYLPRMIWAPIQLRKLINNRATGIWNQ